MQYNTSSKQWHFMPLHKGPLFKVIGFKTCSELYLFRILLIFCSLKIAHLGLYWKDFEAFSLVHREHQMCILLFVSRKKNLLFPNIIVNAVNIRCLVGSTDQACSSGFYFRIEWKSTKRPSFLSNCSLSFLRGLRSTNIK